MTPYRPLLCYGGDTIMSQNENDIRFPPREPNNRFGDMAGGIVPAGSDAGRLGQLHDTLAA